MSDPYDPFRWHYRATYFGAMHVFRHRLRHLGWLLLGPLVLWLNRKLGGQHD